MGDTRPRVLFLDDMAERHKAFKRLVEGQDAIVDYVWSAAEAIQALRDRPYEQAFLDHDLSEEDIMSVVGQPTKVPTGMAVVDFICAMDRPPSQVVIHTCNPPAAAEMARRLKGASNPPHSVVEIPFPHLAARIGPTRS